MIMETINLWLTFITTLILAGEAIALLIGMNFISDNTVEWLSLKNNLLLFIDSITGLLILYLVLFQQDIFAASLLYYLLALTVIVTHVWRDIEYYLDLSNVFLGNFPLFVVNNMKLVGFVIGLVLSFYISSTEI